MCWGVGPTLFFVVVEFSVCAFVWRRNQLYDRDNVFFHVPLLLQEFLQLLIWLTDPDPYHGPGSETLYSCGAGNRVASWLVAVTVWALPLWCNVASTRAIPVPTPKFHPVGGLEKYLSFRKRHLTLAGRFLLWLTGGMTVLTWLDLWPACTTVGPWGHQVWGPAILIPGGMIPKLILTYGYVGLAATGILQWARESYAIKVFVISAAGTQTLVLLPVEILRNTFSDRTHCIGTATARILIPAECSAVP